MRAIFILAAAGLTATPIGAQDCFDNGKFFDLVMTEPAVGPTEIAEMSGWVEKNDVLASQTLTWTPDVRALAADVRVGGEDADMLTKAVPLGAGAPISHWVNASEERWCAIGWKKGLFGGATGDGHYRWICLEDQDGDGLMETAFRTRSKNLGLSFSRVDIPLLEPVALEAGATIDPEDERIGALAPTEWTRELKVLKVSKKGVKLRVQGIADKEVVTLDPTVGATATLGGVEVELLELDDKRARLAVRGDFTAPLVEARCEGRQYTVEGSMPMASFGFPNW